MTRWQYRQVMATYADFEAILNELGQEGWEVIFVNALTGTSPVEMIAVLKREHPPGEPIPRQDTGFV